MCTQKHLRGEERRVPLHKLLKNHLIVSSSFCSCSILRKFEGCFESCLVEREWPFEQTTLTLAAFSCPVCTLSQLKKLLLAPANSQLSYNQYTGGKAQNHAASSNHRIRPPPAVVKVGTRMHLQAAYFTLVDGSLSRTLLFLPPSHALSCFGGRL